jgi:hypothetical protein
MGTDMLFLRRVKIEAVILNIIAIDRERVLIEHDGL